MVCFYQYFCIDVIASIGNTNNKLEEKLLEYIAHLQSQAENVEGIIGLNLCLTARCLHFLNDLFPRDEMCPSTNRLLNYNKYFKE